MGRPCNFGVRVMISNRQSALSKLLKVYPHLENDLRNLRTEHFPGLLAASRKHWDVQRVNRVWHFSPVPGIQPIIQASNDGLLYMSAKDF